MLPLEDQHFCEKGYSFPRKISQGPIRLTVRTPSLAYLELSDGLLETSVGFVRRGSLAGARTNDAMASLTRSTLSICIGEAGTGWN